MSALPQADAARVVNAQRPGTSGTATSLEMRNMITIQKSQAFECRLYKPAPADIRRACEGIQARWSPRERARREATRWGPPTIRLRRLFAAINEELAESDADTEELKL